MGEADAVLVGRNATMEVGMEGVANGGNGTMLISPTDGASGGNATSDGKTVAVAPLVGPNVGMEVEHG
eukprot:gene53810-49919_t